jgi:hypothetical protein
MKKKQKPQTLKRRAAGVLFKPPDQAQDDAALKSHYEQMVATDGDKADTDEEGRGADGITTADLDKIAELAAALKQ